MSTKTSPRNDRRDNLIQAIVDSIGFVDADGLTRLWSLAEANDLLGAHTTTGLTIEQLLMTAQVQYDRRHAS